MQELGIRTSPPLEFQETFRPLPELNEVLKMKENKKMKVTSRSISRDVEYKVRKSSRGT
jgi:hypothetical protein